MAGYILLFETIPEPELFLVQLLIFLLECIFILEKKYEDS